MKVGDIVVCYCDTMVEQLKGKTGKIIAIYGNVIADVVFDRTYPTGTVVQTVNLINCFPATPLMKELF